MSRTRGEFRLTCESALKSAKTSKERNAVKYILMMMQNSANMACDPIGTWPKNDIQAHIAFMMGLNKELRASGELVSAEGLAGPQDAKTVRAGKNGEPVTDGVFPESKEFLAGYWIVDVENADRAYQIAARASAAPGKNGIPLNMPIEVRQVMSGPPEEFI
jgi:hypothetical protein